MLIKYQLIGQSGESLALKNVQRITRGYSSTKQILVQQRRRSQWRWCRPQRRRRHLIEFSKMSICRRWFHVICIFIKFGSRSTHLTQTRQKTTQPYVELILNSFNWNSKYAPLLFRLLFTRGKHKTAVVFAWQFYCMRFVSGLVRFDWNRVLCVNQFRIWIFHSVPHCCHRSQTQSLPFDLAASFLRWTNSYRKCIILYWTLYVRRFTRNPFDT